MTDNEIGKEFSKFLYKYQENYTRHFTVREQGLMLDAWEACCELYMQQEDKKCCDCCKHMQLFPPLATSARQAKRNCRYLNVFIDKDCFCCNHFKSKEVKE